MWAYLFLFQVWVGHATMWTFTLNVAYSRPWHKHFLRAYRGLMAVFILGLPVGLLAGWIPDWYVGVCLFFGVFVLPFVTIRRWVRPRPRQIVAEESTVVDVAKSLGTVPSDGGKRRRMSRLPLCQTYEVEFTTFTLALPGLPAEWDGLTILHLSDLHFIGTPNRAFYRDVMDRCMAGGVPDILAITGDFVDSDTHHRWVIPVLGRLRWNVAAFAVLGNHDWWHRDDLVRRRLTRLGVRVLNNRWECVDVRGRPLVAVGHEGPWYRPAPDLAGCPEGYRLCLSHTPDNIRWARRNGVGLMLAGHNHGGQIRVPGFGSIFVPSFYSRRYDMGEFDEGETFLHVNRGLGGKSPLRFFCRPQVTRFVLKSVAGAEMVPGERPA